MGDGAVRSTLRFFGSVVGAGAHKSETLGLMRFADVLEYLNLVSLSFASHLFFDQSCCWRWGSIIASNWQTQTWPAVVNCSKKEV